MGRRGPRYGARHQVVSGATGDPSGAERSAAESRRREDYIGRGCPSRCFSTTRTPRRRVLAESVSMAMLVVLETLSPDERAVFVLREVFGFDYDEIAGAVGKSAATVRQMAHRAREHVHARRKRFEPVDAARTAQITEQFMTAASTGDMDGLLSMLAPDVTWTADTAARPPRSAGRLRAREGGADPRWAVPGRANACRTCGSRPRTTTTPPRWCLHRRPPGRRVPRRDHRRQDHQLLRMRNPDKLAGMTVPRRSAVVTWVTIIRASVTLAETATGISRA